MTYSRIQWSEFCLQIATFSTFVIFIFNPIAHFSKIATFYIYNDFFLFFLSKKEIAPRWKDNPISHEVTIDCFT